jgi:cobalamin-dependent methionine synthase I
VQRHAQAARIADFISGDQPGTQDVAGVLVLALGRAEAEAKMLLDAEPTMVVPR